MRFGPLIIAIVLAVVCGFIAMQVMGDKEEAPVVTQVAAPVVKEVETVNVLIAAQFIPIGSVVGPAQVTSQPWPKNLVNPNFVIDGSDPAGVVGKVTRSSFQEGEPFSLSKLSGPGEGSFLAGSLPKGFRAVTINTDETLGVAGFVFPGDKVDVMITHRVPKWDQLRDSADMQDVTETLLGNVSVLAVDQIANAQEIAANSPQQQQQQQQGGAPPSTIHVARTATLMVSPVDAQKLRLGEKIGQLSLALRSVEDRDSVDMATLLRLQNITMFPLDSVTNPKGKGGTAEDEGIRVIRGTEAVSIAPVEAQRKTLPASNMPLQQMASGATIMTAPAPAPAAPAATPAATDTSATTTPPPAMPIVTVPSVQTVPATPTTTP